MVCLVVLFYKYILGKPVGIGFHGRFATVVYINIIESIQLSGDAGHQDALTALGRT